MPQTLPASRLWLTVILPFGLGYFITTAYRSINAILAHPLMESLHINAVEVGWVTSTFLLTFALAQLPLGLCLDSWGARKTQTLFFLVGGAGIILFGLASDIMLLALGRAVLGIGMAGGLMAAFKAVSDTVKKDRIPFYNGVILAAGGIGALIATTPSKLFEIEFGWRALCIVLGIITILIALLILFVNRDAPSAKGDRPGIWHQIVALKSIYADRFVWRVSPLFIFSLGGFIAMQGLWLGPWLQRVVGLTPLESANYLLVIAIAMTFGMISGGLFSYLSKLTKAPLTVIVAIGITIHIATQVVIVLNYFTGNYIIWFVYGYFAQVTLVNYAIIAQYFGPELSGRAITAVNIFIFLFAFALQYVFGLVVHLWPAGADPDQPFIAYKVAYSGLIVLQVLGLLWFVFSGRRSPTQANASEPS